MPNLAQCDLAWYVLRAVPKKEHLAAAMIRGYEDVEVFCPRIRYSKRTRRGKVKFVEPLFPTYLFVRADLRTTYRRLMATMGVTGLVAYGDVVPTVPESLIAELRAEMAGEELHDVPDAAIRPGQTVTLLEGPFKNWQAIVSGVIAAKDRVLLLLDFLGRTLEVQVRAEDLLVEGAESPRKSLGKGG